MNESNFTQGEWRYEIDANGDVNVRIGDDYSHDVLVSNHEGVCDECYANAHLISSAPNMHDALVLAPEPVDLEQGLDAVGEFLGAYMEWYEYQRDTALAKARGERQSA